MAEQERKEKRADGPPAGEGSEAGAAGKGQQLKAAMDRLVDEIDDVLEENAEEFVKSYIQRGGE
jgi:ubiquitin-like protein Pup